MLQAVERHKRDIVDFDVFKGGLGDGDIDETFVDMPLLEPATEIMERGFVNLRGKR